MDFALNHVTVPRLGYADLLDLAQTLGCVGVEVRNDLDRPLFDAALPAEAGAMARDRGLRILGVSQIHPFDIWSEQTAGAVRALRDMASEAGAESISLIPRNDGAGQNPGAAIAAVQEALAAIAPLLRGTGLRALVEPLGFETASLRRKETALDAITAVGGEDVFALVHDSFHHHLAAETRMYAAATGIVHLSGVEDPGPATAQMRDADRVLVGAEDRLGNLEQIEELLAQGYRGAFSIEAFAPAIQTLDAPREPLARCLTFIRSSLGQAAA